MRRTLVLSACLSVLVLAASVLPATAGPPERFEEYLTVSFPDLEHEVAVFVNTTRAAECTPDRVAAEEAFLAWIEGGEVGEPPAFLPPPPGIAPVDVQVKDTPGGLVARGSADDLHIELWALDPIEQRPFVGPCLDTDDLDLLVADGTTTYRGNDNAFFGSEQRGNAFGDRGQARLQSADGTEWMYRWTFHINSRCHEPDDAPPACLVDNSWLRER